MEEQAAPLSAIVQEDVAEIGVVSTADHNLTSPSAHLSGNHNIDISLSVCRAPAVQDNAFQLDRMHSSGDGSLRDGHSQWSAPRLNLQTRGVDSAHLHQTPTC